MEIMKNSPIIEIFGCMSRIMVKCMFDNEISFIRNGTLYRFMLEDDDTWTLNRTQQNLNRYDVKFGTKKELQPIHGLIPRNIERMFNGWDGSVSYVFVFDVYGYDDYDNRIWRRSWDFEIKFPREIAKLTTDRFDKVVKC